MAIVVPKVNTAGEQFDEVVIQTPENFAHFTCSPPVGCHEFFHSIKEIRALGNLLYFDHVEVLQDACENIWLRREMPEADVEAQIACLRLSYPKYKIKPGCDLVWLVRSDQLHKLMAVCPPEIFKNAVHWTDCWEVVK